MHLAMIWIFLHGTDFKVIGTAWQVSLRPWMTGVYLAIPEELLRA